MMDTVGIADGVMIKRYRDVPVRRLSVRDFILITLEDEGCCYTVMMRPQVDLYNPVWLSASPRDWR